MRRAIRETALVHEIVGREAQLRAVDRALEAPGDARGLAALVIEGEAGIGKSTLWAEAVRRARDGGWAVISARAVAGESRVTLATLGDLLGAVDEGVFATLPAPQARAVDAARLRADAPGGTVEARTLGVALRSILERLAAAGRLAVAIDDVQWVDPASAAALAFALRRLPDAPILLLVARRTSLPVPFSLGDVIPDGRLTTVAVEPLSVGGLHVLLTLHGGRAPSRATLVRIHRASGGNPLFALEIARVVEAVGEPPAGEPLPVPADVLEILRRRLGAMPRSTRDVLLDLAVLGAADADRLAAVEARDVRPDLDAAVAEELLRLDAGAVEFVHPLYAAAALAVASPAERRSAHARAAATAATIEEAARHRAMATEATDASIAEALEDAAGQARRRGAPLAAAELLRLAIDRTPREDTDARDRRRLALADELKRLGDAAAAIVELEAVAASDATHPHVRARARLALATIHYETDGSTDVAVKLATDALGDAAGDPGLEAHACAVLASVDWDDFRRHERIVADGERFLEQAAVRDPLTEQLLLLARCGVDVEAGQPLDPRMVERALELERVAPLPAVSDRFSASLGTWMKVLDRYDEARPWLEATRLAAIDEGDEGSLPYALAHLPELELWTGDWPRAEALAREHLEIADSAGLASQRNQALYNLALVHAHQGRFDEARAEIAEAAAASEAANDAWILSGVLPILGFIELSLGNASAAVAPLERARALRDGLGVTAPWRPAPDLVEALVATGALQRATEVQDEQERRLARYDRPAMRASAARSRGILLAATGQVEEAGEVLRRSLEAERATPIAFDRARALLALGQVLRRLRQRGAARDAFAAAHEAFDRLGAPAWSERARAELERTGLRRGTGADLTESERRVAELAASGMTNRQVAAALFMSPKTVDANLGRAYAKLGIRSRAELGARLGRPEPDDVRSRT